MKTHCTYLKKVWSVCALLSKRENVSICYFVIDYIISAIRFKCLIRQYSFGDFYKKKNFERKKCVTYFKLLKIDRIFNDSRYVHLLNNKVEFNRHFSDFIKRKWLYSENADSDSFLRLYENGGGNCLIIKPIDCLQGQGVYKYNISETGLLGDFEVLKSKRVLIEECIVQHPAMSFENKSVNTIRVFTVLDNKGNCHIVKAVLRAGVGDAVVDNFCAGGAFYPIDIETGIIDERGMNTAGERIIFHPGTSICMLGYQIPNWMILIEAVEKASKILPQCRFIGWDIAITLQGVEFIEGNQYPDYEFLEFIGKGGLYQEIMSYR